MDEIGDRLKDCSAQAQFPYLNAVMSVLMKTQFNDPLVTVLYLSGVQSLQRKEADISN